MQKLREKADTDAIEVFAKNLRELLLAPPAVRGPRLELIRDSARAAKWRLSMKPVSS